MNIEVAKLDEDTGEIIALESLSEPHSRDRRFQDGIRNS
jgi:hypothetical protein